MVSHPSVFAVIRTSEGGASSSDVPMSGNTGPPMRDQGSESDASVSDLLTGARQMLGYLMSTDDTKSFLA